MKDKIHSIVIIGSGNMAYHLVRAFSDSQLQIRQILARNKVTAGKISQRFNIPYIFNPLELYRDADLYILAVNDDGISDAAGSLKLTNQLLVHTSGSASIDIISKASSATGVVYPLQTLTAGHDIDFIQVPLCIEANSAMNLRKLKDLGSKISGKVIEMNSEKRLYTHLAAVFASNFSNHMYEIAASILKRQNLDFDILLPLIKETANKAGSEGLEKAQTGPAARADLKIIEQHLQLLLPDKNLHDIYKLLTDSIMKK